MKSAGHKQRVIAVKTASVDVAMIPLVRWLNSLDQVYTQHCCEGYHRYKETPYVIFTVAYNMELITILHKVSTYAKVEVSFCEVINQVRYTMRFDSRKVYDDFVKRELRR